MRKRQAKKLRKARADAFEAYLTQWVRDFSAWRLALGGYREVMPLGRR